VPYVSRMLLKFLREPAVQVTVHLAVLALAVAWIVSGNVGGYIFVLLALIALAVDAYQWRRRGATHKAESVAKPTPQDDPPL
jgi:uncharacterized membrane protein